MTNIIILAAVALFLFWRLFTILGNREGYEEEKKPDKPSNLKSVDLDASLKETQDAEDSDIADYIDADSESGTALKSMKKIDNSFTVRDFMSGAKKAYELIIVSFERGDLEKLEPLLTADVFEAFSNVINERANKGYTVDVEFGGVRDMKIRHASYDEKDKIAEISISFVSDICSSVKDMDGKIIDGDPKKINKQNDKWTFYKNFSKKEPNWFLSST